MENTRERVSADDDYFTDDSSVENNHMNNTHNNTNSHSQYDSSSAYDSHGEEDPSDTFDHLEMMEIEMTFSGGKKDNIVVLWGDEPLALATKFVKKHNLKTSAIGNIASHIRSTIEHFKNSNSNISMQSPSLDEHDDSEERSEYDTVMQQQQSNRDSSIQNSLQHEPLDLPTDNQAANDSLSFSRTTAENNISQDNDSYIEANSNTTLSASNLSTSRSDPLPSDVLSPSSLLNHWTALNNERHTSDVSSKDLNVTSSTIVSHSPPPQEHPSEHIELDLTGEINDSSFFNEDGKREKDRDDSLLQPSNIHRPVKPSAKKASNEESGGKQTQTSSFAHPSPQMQNVRNISPIRRGNTATALFPPPTVTSDQRHTHRPVSTGRQVSSFYSNENKDSTNTNPTHHASSTSTTRKTVTKPVPLPTKSAPLPPSSGGSSASTPQSSSVPYTSPLSSSSRGSGSAGGVGGSSADMYNKLKSEWGGNTQLGRRKSVVTGSTSFSSAAGGGNKEPSVAQQQQMAAISGMKQRSTLVVSKAVGGGLYGASVRQPSSGDSETDSQALSSPKKNRLYDDAIKQSKRREMVRQKSLKDEHSRMEDLAYRVPAASRRINNKLSRKDDHLPVGDRLFKEAAVITKKKEETSKLWAAKKETALPDWSCLQCGTYNEIKVRPLESCADPSNILFTCTSCKSSFDASTLEGAMFRPTNVAVMNGTMDDSGRNNRRIGDENIHDYLHANISHETKKLQLLKQSWENEDEVLTFRPIIPQSSKQLLRRYQSAQKENHPNNMSLNAGSSVNNSSSKIIVSDMGLESYLTLPPTERLSKAETLCRVANPAHNEPHPTSRQPTYHKSNDENDDKKKNQTKHLSATKMDDLFTRLTYEYIEKASKLDVTRKEMDRADATGREYFHPTIGVVPSVYTSAPVFSSEKKETIYEKLLRKGAEAKERAKLLKDKVLKKEKNDIEKNYSQPLSKSKTILKESSNQCVEEIFKLLIANQLFFQKHSIPVNNVEKAESGGIGKLSNGRIKLTAEYLNEVSEKLENFENLSLDIRTIDPNLVVEDVQDLLLDLRTLGLKNAALNLQNIQKEEQNEQDGMDEKHKLSSTTATHSSDIFYFVSFKQFQGMIKQCTAKRAGGVGRSYIYTPKPRDTTVKEMLAQESKEYTFCPTITAKSKELAKNRGRGEVPIDVILNDEAYMRDQRIQHIKSLIEFDQNRECTFKPTLYAPPKSVIPTYRGQPREVLVSGREVTKGRVSPAERNGEGEEDDDISLITTTTCSTTIRPSFTEDEKRDNIATRAPTMRQKPSKEKQNNATAPHNRSLNSLFPSSLENSENVHHDVVDISEHIKLEAEEEKIHSLSTDKSLRGARNNSTKP